METHGDHIMTGTLVSFPSKTEYPIVNGIPRFVAPDNHANSFGFQWNLHPQTQFDRNGFSTLSEKRFFEETQWPMDLSGEFILEVGCGSGRFTEHALSTGAMVCSLDYSNAVEANFRNNGNHNNLLLVQGDIYHLPFRRGFFHRVFCFGVLQHTPDVHRSFLRLPEMLGPGGCLAVDVYDKKWPTHWTRTKYWVRPFTSRMDPETLYRWVVKYIDFMWPLCGFIRKIPYVGHSINWRLLVADHSRNGVPPDVLKEWAYLDTFDMLSPKFDQPQTLKTVMRWFSESGLVDWEVTYGYNGIEGRGKKPSPSTMNP